MIASTICKMDEIKEYVNSIASDYNIPNFSYTIKGETDLDNFLESLRDDLSAYIEFPYVDKLYRDSYYNYYSKRNTEFSRNCIRVSFFEENITLNHFDDFKLKTKLQKNDNFLGFLIIRPTIPNRVGRNFINPKAFKDNNFISLKCRSKVFINGQKFKTYGFPHSSQDGSYHSCAETSIWALMEYFGSKYGEYNTVLFSNILSIMKRRTSERQTPSDGLTYDQMSYALRKLGFGSKIFHREVYEKENDISFEELINFYVESAIPVILIHDDGENEMHSNLIIGFEPHDFQGIKVNSKTNKNLVKSKPESEQANFECPSIKDRKFVIIDDNYPPYVKSRIKNNVVEGYKGSKKTKISAFIVPHHNKVFLNAFSAKEIFFSIFRDKDFGINPKYADLKDLKYLVKLIPSRTLKEKISNDSSIPLIYRKSIISVIMPKFIWIAQFATLNSLNLLKTTGIIALDSTSSEKDDRLNTLLFSLYRDKIIFKDGISNMFEEFKFDNLLEEFNLINNNIK